MTRTGFRRQTAAEPTPSGSIPSGAGPRVLPFHAPAGARRAPAPAEAARPALGKLLLDAGEVEGGNLVKALIIARRDGLPLGDVLLGEGWVTPEALAAALGRQWRSGRADLAACPPDPRLLDAVGARLCLAEGLVPWRRAGGVTFVACARPERFEAALPRLTAALGRVQMTIAPEAEIQEAVLARRRGALTRAAEFSVPAAFSCRTRNERRAGDLALGAMAVLAAGLALAPLATLTLLLALGGAMLAALTALKLAALAAWLAAQRRRAAGAEALARLQDVPAERRGPLPLISVMVPLFREADIAPRLIARLAALSYPRALTDILLVVEEEDEVTRTALAGQALPRWMRVVVVPKGRVQTKPRALNWALNFARGQIVGIWDAEDWPDPDQLHKVSRQFDAAPPEVACLQGVLDFYAPRTNWLSRCFTIEYGSWFRCLLPGMAALGIVVPLGGTTCFFRREALERVGLWDAWNVTEDAELGVRLARAGLRTEMLDSVTREEPNCRPRAWVKQRSRWHKGYAMTWGAHMRDPLALWRAIGPRAFLGLQVQMALTVGNFLLAPALWGLWTLSLGLRWAAPGGLDWAMFALLTLGVLAEAVNLAVALAANRASDRRHLWPFVPLMPLYMMLATLAAWKGIYEIVVAPFHWDKTAHGLVADPEAPAEAPSPAVLGTIG